jgi:predicted short-subunit dehydrogenase-like oxidoreductase (DUF2520 family)
MRISIVGSGNVATHIAAALKNAGHQIVQVYSPKYDHAALLAYYVKAEPIHDPGLLQSVDLFLVAVKDDAIEAVVAKLAEHDVPVAHTSGATSLALLEKYVEQAGVFYPLQTFSKVKEVNFKTVPLCIEANNEQLEEMLLKLGSTISQSVYKVSSDQRKILHLAAVFACNFPNYLYGIAQNLLKDAQLDFGLLRPLILETAVKVQDQFPAEVQTGPAVRNDQQTMANHLEMLQQNDYLQQVYRLLSDGIIQMNKS